MNNYKTYFLLLFVCLAMFSCEKDFLDRTPMDQVTEPDFFKNPNDLMVYVNQFYTNSMFPRYTNYGNDFNSDNEVTEVPNSRLRGTRTVSTSGSLPFGNVRNINFFFDYYDKVEEENDLDSYKQYLGEAYFFKGLIYFNLLKSYGDIQWFDHVVETDSPELYQPRTPRSEVVDNIISVLDSAAIYLTEDKTRGAGRVNKWMALLIQSRVALYEGSWEKYHNGTDFGVQGANPDKYFEIAAEASKKIMDSEIYEVYSTGNPERDYKDLFSRMDYSTNSEVMFWREYDNGLSRGDRDFTNDRNFRMEKPDGHSITKELADAYLAVDGDPINVSPLYQGDNTLEDEMENRDPRFYQTIATPGEVWKIPATGSNSYWSEAYANINSSGDYNAPTGYLILKGYNPNMEYHVQQFEETPSIIFRYGEVLLNYAEAKAELEDITQSDLDISLNKLRDRVAMPDLKIGAISHDPNWDFPGLSPLINEIRRERRIELALEGFRWDDIARWAAADELIIGKRPKGLKADQLARNSYPVDEDGYVDPYQTSMPTGYGFILGRDYLNSIPESEINLNPDLTQNPGW